MKLEPLQSVTNLNQSAINVINANNDSLTTALNNTVSLDGSLPNEMGGNLDMNSNRILNLLAPATPLEPVRLQDLATYSGGTINFPSVYAYPGGVNRTYQLRLQDTVSVADFGAVGDGNIANANVNATALANALATGKSVFIPWTSSGYHFGTNTITLGTGQTIVGESAVTLLTTNTTMMFSCNGIDHEWGAHNLTIQGNGVTTGTIFRMRIASNIVYRGRFSNITFNNCAECFGDETTSSFYTVDMRISHIKITSPNARSIYFRVSAGFMYFDNIQHDMTGGTIQPNWEAGRFDNATGLEIYRWDVSGGISGTPTYLTNSYGLSINNSTSVWLNRVEIDSTWGNGIAITNVRFLRMNECSAFANLGNAMSIENCNESALSNLTLTGSHGLTGDGGGSGLSFTAGCNQISAVNIYTNLFTSTGLIVSGCSDMTISNYTAFGNFSYAYALVGLTSGVILSDSTFTSNNFTVLNTSTGTGNVIHDVVGYNPVGSVALTPTNSPWSYTTGLSPETLYLSSSTSLDQVFQAGLEILPHSIGANQVFTLQLGPNETPLILYTGTLTANKMVH